jgi:hypothetical protein
VADDQSRDGDRLIDTFSKRMLARNEKHVQAHDRRIRQFDEARQTA